MSTSITSSITDGQQKQYRRFIEDATRKGADLALEQVPLDKDGFQRLIENGDELNSAIAAVIVAKTRELSISNQFADEEVESRFGYLSGYQKPKGITEQTNILRRLFPGFGFADEKIAEQPLPPNTEGWFAIPKWETIGSTYGEAVQKVLDKIKETRGGKFYNYRAGKLGPQYLRQSAKSIKAFQKLGTEQKDHDIFVVAAQFGLRHRGRSVRRAREVMNASEFGLGAFAIGIMLLTHPERLKHYDDLWIDCAGDEFSCDGGGQFVGAPYFVFFGDGVRFDAHGVDAADDSYGSASASVSQ
jgi:hypothetical protein